MGILIKFLLVVVATVLFLLYSPTLPDVQPQENNLPLPTLTGPLAANNKLSEAEHLLDGILHAPESLVFHKGDIYTGLVDGRIVKVKGDVVTTVAQTGRDCKTPYDERICGRPLGLRVGKDGLLYIADGYYGIFSMNFTTGSLEHVLPISTFIDGQKMTFPDDLDVDSEGNIYFTDASTKWDLSMSHHIFVEREHSGRVIKHNIHTGVTEVLLRNLCLPNGIQLSQDGKSLLICETCNRRILRYHIKGAKKGQQEVFADILPASPDNIRPSSKGGYWVGLFSSVGSSWHVDHLNKHPLVKKLCVRALYAIAAGVMRLADITSCPKLMEYGHKIRRGKALLSIMPRHGIIVELDKAGKILRSFQSPDGKTTDISEVSENNGYLYLGSFNNDYLGRLKL